MNENRSGLSETTDSVALMKNGKTLFAGNQAGGVYAYDYTDDTAPSVINYYTFGFLDNDVDSIFVTEDEKIMVIGSGTRGVLIIDMSNI